MHHLTRTSIAFGFAALLPVSPLHAQDSQVAMSVPVVQVAPAPPAPTIEEMWEAATKLQLEGNLRASLDQFAAIAEIQRQEGINAAQTFWKIAEIQNALGSRLRTAQALDNAAREAGTYGDVELQARSLFEAAVNYTAANQTATASNRMRRLEGLVNSAGVSDELRARIERRRASN